MSKLTINDFTKALGIPSTQIYDIVNAITNSNPLVAQYVPLASATNVAEVGAGIMLNRTVQNEFITALVDRIALFVLQQKTLTNILAPFKKGQLPLGSKIEETYIDLVKAKVYDADVAESEVFKRVIPDVKTLFHEINRKDFYKQTIQDASLKQAFISWTDFGNFTAGIIQAMYNSNQVDEFKYMKLLLESFYSNGLFKIINLPNNVDNPGMVARFLESAREAYTLMTLPTGSREFNAMGVHTMTLPEDFIIIIDSKLRASMDVNALASAFNLDKADLIGRVITIDNFSVAGLKAIALDASFFMVYDVEFTMESIRNPQGKYWNYFLHVWQVMSASRFANAVAFVSQTTSGISQVIVNPPLASVKKGNTIQLDAMVRTFGTPPTYTLTATEDGSATTVSVQGDKINVTVPVGETNSQVTITVTATWTEGQTTKTQSGVATLLVS